jgi:hypothetical protein
MTDAPTPAPPPETGSDPEEAADYPIIEPIDIDETAEGADSMADVTPVNGQITDAVTQTNITVLGNSPAIVALGMFQSFAQSMALAMQNAVAAQQQANISSQAMVAAAIAKMTKSRSPSP